MGHRVRRPARLPEGLLGQAEGRTSATVTGWLLLRSKAFRDAVRYVVIDPTASYRAAITPELLPNARLVVDHFHLVLSARYVAAMMATDRM